MSTEESLMVTLDGRGVMFTRCSSFREFYDRLADTIGEGMVRGIILNGLGIWFCRKDQSLPINEMANEVMRELEPGRDAYPVMRGTAVYVRTAPWRSAEEPEEFFTAVTSRLPVVEL